MPIRQSISSLTDPGKIAMEAPSPKSGLSAKPKANVGRKASEPRHATEPGQVDGQKSTKPKTQNDEDSHVLNRVRRRSTGSSSIVSRGPTMSQKCSGGRAPIDRHGYVDDSRSSSTKNKASSSDVKTAANRLSPPNVPSHSLFGRSQASSFGSSLFGGFQASPSGSRNASSRGFPAFGSRKSDNSSSDSLSVSESSEDEGQNELSTRSIFGFCEPVKGQRRCTFKIPRGKEYTLWLSDGFNIYDIVSDGTLYRKGRTLINREGKSLTELEPDLPDKVRACEIREGQSGQKFWLDFVHRGREQHEGILRKRTAKLVAETDEKNEDEESEAEEDDNNKNNEASEDDNSNDDTSESGEHDIRESEELIIDLEKTDIEKLRSEGLEVDWEKLGRNYRLG